MTRCHLNGIEIRMRTQKDSKSKVTSSIVDFHTVLLKWGRQVLVVL